jgi:hypothetical protein
VTPRLAARTLSYQIIENKSREKRREEMEFEMIRQGIHERIE